MSARTLEAEPELRPCACGCGEPVERSKHAGRVRTYAHPACRARASRERRHRSRSTGGGERPREKRKMVGVEVQMTRGQRDGLDSMLAVLNKGRKRGDRATRSDLVNHLLSKGANAVLEDIEK